MTIASKISQIIAHADSTTNSTEAAAFMKKAQKLMREYGINLMDLGRLSDDPIELQYDAFVHPKAYRWMRRVASAAAKFYGCDFVTFTRGSKEFYQLSGRESARVTFALMMPYIIRQVRAQGRVEHAAGNYSSGAQADTYIGNALARRIYEMCPEEPEPGTAGVNALVPVDIIQALLMEQYPKAKPPRKSKINIDYVAMLAAARVSVLRQTEADEDDQLKLENKS